MYRSIGPLQLAEIGCAAGLPRAALDDAHLRASGQAHGMVIRHGLASPGSQSSHVLAVVRASLVARLMTGVGLAPTLSPALVAAVRLPAIARAADRELLQAPSALRHSRCEHSATPSRRRCEELGGRRRVCETRRVAVSLEGSGCTPGLPPFVAGQLAS
jgi:hypothetical protein